MRFHFLSSSSSTVAFLLLAASPSGLLFQAGLADAAGVKQQDIAGVDDLIPLPNADASSILVRVS